MNVDTIWFTKLISYCWSHFDSNIDVLSLNLKFLICLLNLVKKSSFKQKKVIKNTSLQNYKILLNIAKSIISYNVETFYQDEVKKCLQLSWQSNSKLNALILLLDDATSVTNIMNLNPNMPNELIEAVTERSSACLVNIYKLIFLE